MQDFVLSWNQCSEVTQGHESARADRQNHSNLHLAFNLSFRARLAGLRLELLPEQLRERLKHIDHREQQLI